MTLLRIALIGCGRSKLERSAPARELYTGPLFRAALAYAEVHFDAVMVLSAEHGAVPLDEALDPYDTSIRDLSPEDRAEWAHQVMFQVADTHGRAHFDPVELHVFAGSAYVEPLRWQLSEWEAWAVEDPLHGLQIGQRIQWFRLQRERGTGVTATAENPFAAQGITPALSGGSTR